MAVKHHELELKLHDIFATRTGRREVPSMADLGEREKAEMMGKMPQLVPGGFCLATEAKTASKWVGPTSHPPIAQHGFWSSIHGGKLGPAPNHALIRFIRSSKAGSSSASPQLAATPIDSRLPQAMQHVISACKPHHAQPAAALLPRPPRWPLPGRAAALPRRRPVSGGNESPPRLVVRRRCQEEDNQQQQQEAAEGSGADEQEKRTFLSLEEAGLVEMSGLDTHERFLCRLTISSLNLLRVISEQEGVPIEELNAGRVCDWFLKDKLKREQNIGTAVLQWDDPGF